MGWPGNGGEISQLDLDKPGRVNFETSISAMLEKRPSQRTKSIRTRRLDAKPYWHIERCRIGDTRKVKAELVVNGQAVDSKEVLADGSIQDINWNVDIKSSSWVAVRILPSVHTNPIFVQVEGRPIRASRKSAQWCRQAVDVCWNSKQNQIRKPEKEAAKTAYDQAAKIYDEIIAASKTD